jgi:putative membrane-bound dehydrogenase-like protein
VVPEGFRATLFACDPLVEYPSAVALGPRPGTLLVAADYMTGLGAEIVRRDEIRLIEDTDGDGYADRATVFAEGFNSIEGLTWHDGVAYAMHAPLLTALRDADGDGRAEDRRDLLTGLGLPPEENPHRLHCANGVVVGHDGWLYLALGDHGCDVPRPEGDRLVLHGGGILRCQPDGRELHVFAAGLRNIYDVALDAELNAFVRDNENDGGEYKIRVCHSFFGADHGYPYDYYERPEAALPPLADLGLGSSAGGACYLETQFPPEYRGNLFFCEWGRAVVRYRPAPAGSGFGPVVEEDFAVGAPADPYGFKPTDVVVDRDGSLVVADWGDGQQPKRGRGRIYRIAYVGQPDAVEASSRGGALSGDVTLAALDSPSYFVRVAEQQAATKLPDAVAVLAAALEDRHLGPLGRMHCVWALAQVGDEPATEALLRVAATDPDPRLQAQAVRALADRQEPALGDRIARIDTRSVPFLVREVVLALGRLRWPGLPEWLRANVGAVDPPLAHAGAWALRQAGDWPAVLGLLDGPSDDPLRAVARRALTDQFDAGLIDGLIARLASADDPARRIECAEALARVHCRAGPWVYWGYRPGPRPANSVPWKRTAEIAAALAGALDDPRTEVRLAVLRQMEREAVPVPLETLSRLVRDERQIDAVSALLHALTRLPAADVRGLLQQFVHDADRDEAHRLLALAAFDDGLDLAEQEQLLHLADGLADGPLLAELLRRAGRRPGLAAGRLAMEKLASPVAEVRLAALEALTSLRVVAAANAVCPLLDDGDPRVRAAAATAAGKLGAQSAADALLALAVEEETAVRRAALAALAELGERRALPIAVAALHDRATQREALACVGSLGGADQIDALVELARRDPAAETLLSTARILSDWGQRPDRGSRERTATEAALAALQGTSGALVRWRVLGPLADDEVDSAAAGGALDTGRTALAEGTDARVRLSTDGQAPAGGAWLAAADLALAEEADVEFFVTGGGALRAWLNGAEVLRRDEPRPLEGDAERFTALLPAGPSRLIVQLSSAIGEPQIQARFRRRSATLERERLAQAALAGRGDAERGRALFLDAMKSQCIKCHRIGDRGERIGPELSGVGSRFARAHLVDSILEPSRAVSPAFATVIVQLADGRVISGIKLAETDTTLTLADNRGEKHEIPLADIDERSPSAASTMPEGLEKQLTAEEFVDLVEYLASQQEVRE